MRPLRIWLAGAVLAASTAAAQAAPGKVWLEVTADPGGADALVRGAVDIAVPPEAVWRRLLDCAATQRMMASIRTCKVTDRDPQGRWDVREHVVKIPFEPQMRTVFRSSLTTHRAVSFRQVEGDMKLMEGEWRLEPLDGGRATRVTYQLRLTPACGAPMLVRAFLRRETQSGLATLRTESERS